MSKKLRLLVVFHLLLLGATARADGTDGARKAIKLYQTMMSATEGDFEQRFDGATKNCLRDELTVSQIEEAMILPLKTAIEARDQAYLNGLGLGNVAGLGRSTKAARTTAGIAEFDWNPKAQASLAQHAATFDQIEFAELKVDDYFIDSEIRAADGSFNKINLRVRMDLRGKRGGKLAEDRATLMVSAVQNGKDWQIKGVNVLKGVSLVQNGVPSFVDVTESSRLADATVYRRTEAIRRGGYALAVADVNGDGLVDMLVGNRGTPELWMGAKDGTFARAAENPFRDEKFTKTAVFADFNNDGRQDVVITRFNEKKGAIKGSFGPQLDVVVYENKDGKFVLKNQELGGREERREPMPAAVADFDGDGFLDFYVGYPGKQDFSQMSRAGAQPMAKVQGLYLNDRKGFFRDFTESAFKNQVDYQGRLFPHSSFAADFNQDGHQDLMVADDRGNVSPLFMNAGNGKFVERSGENGIVNRGYSMSIAAGDINNTGRTDLAITNVSLTDFDRLRSACGRHFNRGQRLTAVDAGLRIFQAKKDGKYEETTKSLVTDHPGDATAGMTFIDYNNDGFMDLYVVNGLWSGTPKGQDLGSFFTSLMAAVSSRYALREADSLHFMELLSDLKGRIANYADGKSIQAGPERPSLGGYQRNRLYRNNGNGTFTEVGFLEGVDSMADGYIVAKADLNNDGKMDLVLRNGDPGTDEHRFPVVQVYRNQNEAKAKSVTLTFSGSKSNRDGFGLFAKAKIGATTQVQHLAANSGSVQEQRILHFGLGSQPVISRLEIHWPAGGVQVLKNVKSGLHHVTEPSDVRPAKIQPASPKPLASN